jgi:hypothetical protein
VVIAVACAVGGRLALAAWLEPVVSAPGKDEVGVEDDENVNRRVQKANVLFFLDTSHPMMFEPRGRMPYVVEFSEGVINSSATQSAYGYSAAEAIDMMKYATFGVGTVPPADSFYTSKLFKWVNYGRDTNSGNNLTTLDLNTEENLNRYYSPYAQSGHNLQATFRNQTDAYHNEGPPGLGYSFNNTSAIVNNRPLPYMLVFKNPAYWENGMPGFNPNNPAHRDELVPNDSRLYQTKLVMWRLLEDRMLFENIRFGLSTVYSAAFTSRRGLTNEIPSAGDPSTVTPSHIVYKVAPWGANGTYVNGAYYVNSNGITWSNTWMNPSQQGGTWGIYTEVGDVLNRQRRSFLRVPIAEYDKMWTTRGGALSMTQLARFRQWIDGVEDIAGQANMGTNSIARDHALNANQFDIHKNPELKVSSPVHLSRAFFPNPSGNPNRAWYFANRGVAYAKKNDIFYAESGGANDLYNFYFKPGSGQAVGGVLDFFSPDYDKFNTGISNLGYTNGSLSGESFADMIDEQFPIRDECDPNYVVLLTAGDNSPSEYPTENAIKALYDHTKNNSVTVMYHENGVRKFRKGRLQKPIKTIVVGFIDKNDNSTTGLRLKQTLLRMARAGQGDSPDDSSSTAQPYIASDVPTLLAALREIMVIINSDMQPAKGALLEGPSLSTDDLAGLDPNDYKLNLYAGEYRINMYDQWEGSLTKYVAAKDKTTGEIVTKKDGELGANIRSHRDANASNPRNLIFWNGGAGGNFAHVGYTGRTNANRSSAHPLADLVGLGAEIVTNMDFPPNGSLDGRTHPSRAMFDWYYGYDVSYADGNNDYFKRRFMLADQGRSGIVKVGPPSVLPRDSLPGFRDFAQASSGVPNKIYLQTNDGVMHVVDAATMKEDKAILPPPTLLPRRMFRLKANLQANGKYRWVDVRDFNANTSDDIPISSAPAYLLDGPLQMRHFDTGNVAYEPGSTSGSHDWRAFLFGTLGRGGGGIYAMDASDSANPKFYWYRETVENDDGSVTLLWRAQDSPAPSGRHAAAPYSVKINRGSSYWNDVYANPDAHPYEQWGFNSQKPYFGVTRIKTGENSYKYKNLVAIGGGMQTSHNINDNGKMGAALYLVDPTAEYHGKNDNHKPEGSVRVFNSGSLAGVSSRWRVGSAVSGSDPYMGMVNSKPGFLASYANPYESRGLFFVDNRGSIFFVNFTDPDRIDQEYSNWNDWEIRTVGTLRKTGDPATASYSAPSGVTGDSKYRSQSVLWIAGGTANAPIADPVDTDNMQLINEQQLIFAFKVPDLTDGELAKRSEWEGLDPETTATAEVNDPGWYSILRPAGEGYKDEYVTGRPELFDGGMYVATFQEKKINPGSTGACETSAFNGESRLYAFNLENGGPWIWGGDADDKKYLKFNGIKFRDFTVSKTGDVPTLIVSYQVLDKAAADNDIATHVANEDELSKLDGLDALSIRMREGGGTGGHANIPPNEGILNYWRFVQEQ